MNINRRDFLKWVGLSSAGLLLPGTMQSNILRIASENPNIKPISGSWFEFQHLGPVESEYWDKHLAAFTTEQWKEKVYEIREIGMEYLVLMSIAAFDQAFYPSSLAPQFKMACDDPLEAVLTAADECGIKFFVSNDFWGNGHDAYMMMRDMSVREKRVKSMEEIVARYGHHKSFYGWYFPNEAQLQPYFTDAFVDYVNDCTRVARSLTPNSVNLIAPYYIIWAKNDDKFLKQIENLDIDIVAYQDGVGVNHTKLGDAGNRFKILYDVHKKAGRSRLWADMELFYFEQGTKGNLMPADFETRIIKQMEDISPYVEKILVYQYIGIMNKPDSKAHAGHPDSVRLYNQYKAWLDRQKRI